MCFREKLPPRSLYSDKQVLGTTEYNLVTLSQNPEIKSDPA